MSKKIKAGETVEITKIFPGGPWDTKYDKETFIGMEVNTTRISASAEHKGYYYIDFISPISGNGLTMKVKIRRIKP